jgi:hypothetical protein
MQENRCTGSAVGGLGFHRSGEKVMSKQSYIADVRSILSRSLDLQPLGEICDRPGREFESNEIRFPSRIEPSVVDRAREVMRSLETATVLSRLFPGAPLVLIAVPEPESQPKPEAEPLPMRCITTGRTHSGDLASIIRTAMVEEFPANVPAAAESLLGELGVIERQDRGYYLADQHSDDAVAAYNYRQRRRTDILAELLELKRDATNPY